MSMDKSLIPTTAAGRILLREHSSGTPHMVRHIIDIEHESALRQLERDEHEAITPMRQLLADVDAAFEKGEGMVAAAMAVRIYLHPELVSDP